mmetsp:Transcript_2710/g.9335  ORF Transcript_2710/g.9335 Transcript_2710/m.9335 type:complete len:244 (+) Transcript_2710:3116-3847(+)
MVTACAMSGSCDGVHSNPATRMQRKSWVSRSAKYLPMQDLGPGAKGMRAFASAGACLPPSVHLSGSQRSGSGKRSGLLCRPYMSIAMACPLGTRYPSTTSSSGASLMMTGAGGYTLSVSFMHPASSGQASNILAVTFAGSPPASASCLPTSSLRALWASWFLDNSYRHQATVLAVVSLPAKNRVVSWSLTRSRVSQSPSSASCAWRMAPRTSLSSSLNPWLLLPCTTLSINASSLEMAWRYLA